MLRLEALEVIQRFRKPGGDEFVFFCNKIIRASCLAHGVPQSEIETCSRTEIPDKGVDTRVLVPILGDNSGYFDQPSIWQFKAEDESHIGAADMVKEVNKPRARQWISEGSAYRICICDHLTPDKKQTLNDALCDAVADIKDTAPKPRILSIDDIVGMANSFPALVVEYRPGLDEICILFDQWRKMAIGSTPTFVPAAGFEGTKNAILAQTDFGNEVPSAVVTLYGSAGVGKTRVALESLQEVPGVSSLVVYTTSEDDVRSLANMLANDKTAHAMIVADESSIGTQEHLSRTLINFRSRVRCICIDNSTQRPITQSPELEVRRHSVIEVEKVLAANFKGVPPDRLRVYAQYSGGFIRLAADMCAHYDPQIAQAGNISPVMGKIENYYRERLRDDSQREALEAIALLKRVRYKGEAPTDFDLLCELTGTDKRNIERALSQIKDSPGWVEKGALYYRVTPDLIAVMAFKSAWARWAQDNEEEFLQRIPPSVQESFLQRVAESGYPEVRETVQRFFRRFADDFTPRDLGDVRLVNRFVSLIETDPSLYLGALRRVIEAATHNDLTAGPEWTANSWGPRRQLVWTAEQFAIFAEHFHDCEIILFTLAKHESEPRIGNNATKTWQTFFRLQLSGTSLPLAERLNVLRDRLEHATEGEAELFAGALDEIIDFMGTKIVGPPVVGGRVPPPEWHPRDWGEMKHSVMEGLKLLDEATRHPISEISSGAKKALLDAIEVLTRGGWADQLRTFVSASNLSESDKARLVGRVKNFLSWGTGITAEQRTVLEDWLKHLEPKSFHGRLVESVGCNEMTHFEREKEWESELDQLATELLKDERLLETEINWLTSSEAESAFQFGSRLGRFDETARLLDKILEHSRERHIGLIRGYIAGLLYGAGVQAKLVEERLDKLELRDALLSFQIALAGGNHVGVFDRAVRLIKAGKIPPHYLRNFTHWVGDVRVTNDQVAEAVRLLLPVANKDSSASDVMVDFLGARLHSGQLQALLETDKELIWHAITVACHNPGREMFWLAKVLEKAAATDFPLAIRLACAGLVSENYELARGAEGLLAHWASQFPEEVMAGLGAMVLDERVGWKLLASKMGVLNAIPPKIVIHWLESAGARGAQRIARHLPRPFVNASGVAHVPELTEFVLSRFGDDDLTFKEFCAGTHHLQMYVGDIASQREAEAKSVRPFFNNKIKRIREWARYEYDSGIREAGRHREREDEEGI
jgi:hypothetical protein